MKYRVWLLAIVCFFIPNIILAKSEYIKVKVGVEKLGYLPYYNVDVDGEYVGFARELFEKFQENSNFIILYRPYPVSRLYKEFFSGSIDAKFPDHPEWKKNERTGKNIFYSQKVVKFTDGIIKRVSFNKQIQKVSIVRGFTPWMLLGEKEKYSFEEVNTFQSAVKMVLKERVDGVYGNIFVIRHSYEELGYKAFGEDLELAKDISSETDFYHLSSFNSQKFIEAFNEFLNKSNFIETLLKKYKLSM